LAVRFSIRTSAIRPSSENIAMHMHRLEIGRAAHQLVLVPGPLFEQHSGSTLPIWSRQRHTAVSAKVSASIQARGLHVIRDLLAHVEAGVPGPLGIFEGKAVA